MGFKQDYSTNHGGSKSATKVSLEKIKNSPNIIHLHNIHGYYINIEITFQLSSKKSILLYGLFIDCWQ